MVRISVSADDGMASRVVAYEVFRHFKNIGFATELFSDFGDDCPFFFDQNLSHLEKVERISVSTTHPVGFVNKEKQDAHD